MTSYIALYRGINVGGKTSVKMERLRAMHEQMGHRDVKSYIQSGNIVFCDVRKSPARLARELAEEFADEFGFAVQLVVVDGERWGDCLDNNPFAAHSLTDPKLVHIAACDGRPDADGPRKLLAKTGGNEAFVIRESLIYLYAPDGLGKSKFAAGMEKACGVPLTLRNWRTAQALGELVAAAK